VRMRVGGVTNHHLIDILRGNWRSYVALRELGLVSDLIYFFFKRFMFRIPTFFNIKSTKFPKP
jgi:hypothetical protein